MHRHVFGDVRIYPLFLALALLVGVTVTAISARRARLSWGDFLRLEGC